jgi:ABC-type transport system involved in multi-copper enzyme maturation permease subunit
MDIPTNLSDFFIWIGSPLVVGAVLSLIAERVWPLLPAEFPGGVKHALVIVASIGLPLLSKLNPWWQAIVAGLMVYLTTQAAHTVRKYFAARS